MRVGLIAAVLVSLVGSPGPLSRAAVLRAKIVGKLERLPAFIAKRYKLSLDFAQGDYDMYGAMILMPRQRVLFQGYRLESDRSVLVARDADSLAVKGILELDGNIAAMFATGGHADWTHAIDDAGGRLFLGWTKTQTFTEEFLTHGYWTIDAKTLSVRSTALPVRGGLAHLYENVGMTYDRRTDRVYMGLGQLETGLFTDVTYVDNAPSLVLAMRASPKAGEDALLYIRPIRSCRSYWPVHSPLLGARYTIPIVSAQDAEGVWRIHVPCGIRPSVVGIVSFLADPEVDGQTRIARDVAESSVVGPPQVYSILADPTSARMALIAQVATGTILERVMWVYDARAAAFIGVFRASAEGDVCTALRCPGYGMDFQNGRVLGFARELGLFFVSLRLNPVPQPVSYQGYRDGPANKRIWFDPVDNRVFVLRAIPGPAPDDEDYARAYEIVRVPPPTPAPPPTDPDRFTTNRPEGEDTAVSFSASGSGYGVRILLAQGINGTIPSFNEAVTRFTSLTRSKCGFTDRALVFSHVDTSTLGESSASARAAEFDVDSRTKVHLERPSSCDTESIIQEFNELVFGGPLGALRGPFDGTAGRRWSRQPAECENSDDEGDSRHEPGDAEVGTAHVSCRFSKSSLAAVATSHVSTPGFKVASSTVTLSIGRARGKGATTRTESVVRGIHVGDVGIGEVRSVAEATSAGRPGTARAIFHRQILGVSGPGLPEGAGCENTGCEELITRLNVALGGRAVFRLTQPNPELCRNLDAAGACKGTPRGAQAGILKSEFQRASDNALSGDQTYEIPGLELIVFNDSPQHGRARQLIQLAGVRADASYNISLVPAGLGAPELPTEVLPAGPSVPNLSPVAPDAVAPSAELGPQPVREVLRRVGKGLKFFLASPSNALKVGTAWVLLMSPAILALRRRRLRAPDSIKT